MRSVLALSVAAVAQAATLGAETVHSGSAPVLGSVETEAIPDSYIIKFKDHVDDSAATDHHSWVQNIHDNGEQQRLELRKRSMSTSEDIFSGLKHTFKIGDAFKGYAGHFDESVIEQVRNHPDVEFIERDSIVHTMLPLDVESKVTEDKCDGETEKQAPWGLARISHRETLNFGTFNKYLYTAEGGEGVDAYVIDTGTNIEHVDFEGRAKWGKTIPSGDEDVDGNGHGTHCSGTVAGKKYGVAKKAHVYAVKVLRSNGSGTMSDVVKGVEYAATSHIEQVKSAKDGKRKGFKGSVANMSLGGGKTQALDAAVNAAVRSGVHFAVAAGNDNADACKYSPAAASEPLTVGASALDDSRAYFSNYGKCTDIFAPGLSIQSTWIGSKYAVNTISGTSMASPHIAGLLAYYLSLQPAIDSEYASASISPKQLKEDIISISTKGALSDLPDSDTPNALAWNGAGCSNFSKIVEAGDYQVKRTPSSVPSSIKELEAAIEDDFEVVSGKVVKGAKTLGNKAEKFAKKIHDIVDEEIHEFLSEISVSHIYSEPVYAPFNPTSFRPTGLCLVCLINTSPPAMFRRNSSKNKQRRPLIRSKSTNSVAGNPVHDLESIDPFTAQRDAYIAARLSYYRAHGRYPPNLATMPQQHSSRGLSRSDTITTRTGMFQSRNETSQQDGLTLGAGLQRQQSVRFTGESARPRRVLAARAAQAINNPVAGPRQADMSATKTDDSKDEAISAGSHGRVLDDTEKYYAVEDDIASFQSSYRKLRKSRSLFNSPGLARSEYSSDTGMFEQPKRWNHGTSRYASLNSENERESVESQGLRAPKSMSFLRTRREHQNSQVGNQGGDDLAVQLAREKFQHQMDQQKRLKSQPSLFFRSKNRWSGSSAGLRKSLRNSSNTSAAVSSAFSGDTVLVQKNGLRKTARKVSNTLRSKFKGLFQRSKSEESHCQPPIDKAVESDGNSCLHHNEELGGQDEASVSQVQSHVPSLHAVPSNEQIRSRQGSMDSLKEGLPAQDDKSRVTSWTSSTAETFAASSTIADWEGQRLSVIKENGMHLSASCLKASGQVPLLATGPTIDSERIYSALMKRLEETKREEKQRERSVEDYREFGVAPPRGSSVDRVGMGEWSPPTIRCVRADDDVFQHETVEMGVEKPTRHYKSSPNIQQVSLQGMSQTSDVREVVGAVIPYSYKEESVKTDLRQPRTISQRSSAFFASPTCHLFRTASPYRRALRENMKASADAQGNDAPDLQYLKSLSSFSLPLRRTSTAGSDKEDKEKGAESVYSYNTDHPATAATQTGRSLMDRFPEPPKSQTHGDVTIFVEQKVPRTLETPAREFSIASSVEWKTWLSSHVSKLEGTSVTDKADVSGACLLPTLGHVRENAEIESSGDGFEPGAILPAGPSSGPLKAIRENNVQPSAKQQPKLLRTPSCATDENAVPTPRTENSKVLRKMPSSIPSRNSLREVQSAIERSSQSTWQIEATPRPRLVHEGTGSSPLTREEMQRRRRARMGMIQPAYSPAKSSSGLSTAAERYSGTAAGGSPQHFLTQGPRSIPNLRGEAKMGDNSLTKEVLERPTFEGQTLGSKRMVEIFLSSRRSRGNMRSGPSSDGSPTVFL
ncbi:Subtilisin-like proteinase Spm1 [Paramyrothecium foliicola]|nr:Subtilisin-like proteinase Spm1 [Paramyrothecium foliicola]